MFRRKSALKMIHASLLMYALRLKEDNYKEINVAHRDLYNLKLKGMKKLASYTKSTTCVRPRELSDSLFLYVRRRTTVQYSTTYSDISIIYPRYSTGTVADLRRRRRLKSIFATNLPHLPHLPQKNRCPARAYHTSLSGGTHDDVISSSSRARE